MWTRNSKRARELSLRIWVEGWYLGEHGLGGGFDEHGCGDVGQEPDAYVLLVLFEHCCVGDGK